MMFSIFITKQRTVKRRKQLDRVGISFPVFFSALAAARQRYCFSLHFDKAGAGNLRVPCTVVAWWGEAAAAPRFADGHDINGHSTGNANPSTQAFPPLDVSGDISHSLAWKATSSFLPLARAFSR